MKEAFITGASSGIGAAAAEIFSEKGWKVYLLGRSQERLLKVQSLLKGPSEILVADLAQENSFAKIQEFLEQKETNVHTLVNNAGVFQAGSLLKDGLEAWQTQWQVNAMGPLRLTRLLWTQLKKNKGCITNVSSTLGTRPIRGTGAYSASKAALNSWTQTLALEAAPDVRVNAVEPGFVDTPIHAFHGSEDPKHVAVRESIQKLQPMGRIASAKDIAGAIYLLSQEEAGWITGSVLPVDGGMHLTYRDS